MQTMLLKFISNVGPWKNRIDANSKLRRIDRDAYKYIEGDRKAFIQIEMLHGDVKKVIYLSSLKKWDPPFSKEAINDEERVTIAKKIQMYFRKHGVTVEIQYPDGHREQ